MHSLARGSHGTGYQLGESAAEVRSRSQHQVVQRHRGKNTTALFSGEKQLRNNQPAPRSRGWSHLRGQEGTHGSALCCQAGLCGDCETAHQVRSRYKPSWWKWVQCRSLGKNELIPRNRGNDRSLTMHKPERLPWVQVSNDRHPSNKVKKEEEKR